MPLVAERLLLDRLVTLDNLPSDSSESKPLPLHVEMIDVHKVGPLQPLPSNSGKWRFSLGNPANQLRLVVYPIYDLGISEPSTVLLGKNSRSFEGKDLKWGPLFWTCKRPWFWRVFQPQNKGQTASRYMHIVCIMSSSWLLGTWRRDTTMASNRKRVGHLAYGCYNSKKSKRFKSASCLFILCPPAIGRKTNVGTWTSPWKEKERLPFSSSIWFL